MTNGAAHAAMLALLCRPIVRYAAACACACAGLLACAAHAGEPAPATMLEASVPEYPGPALRRNDEGTAHVLARVLASGQVSDVRIQRSSGTPDLDAAAVAAATRSTFRAARNAAGEPVDSWVMVPYRFVLQD